MDPRHFYALHLLSTIAGLRGRHEDCIRLASEALQVDPHNAEAMSNRAAALRTLCRFEEALQDYDRALAISPNSASILNNRGVALASLGRHGDAVLCYEKALRIDAAYARARYNRALSRLVLGRFSGAWEDYEWRWTGGESPGGLRPFAFPMFERGDFGRGHRIALWCEQGLGDTLVFSTLAEDLERRGESFVLEADRRVVPAIARAHPHWQVVSREESPKAFQSCDRHLPLGSLGALFRRSPDDFHRQPLAFVAPDVARSRGFRERIVVERGLVVGISWRTFQSKGRSFYERMRSTALAYFTDLSLTPGLRLVDLQYGDTLPERETFARAGGKLDRMEELDLYNDLDGLIALISACDVVITTDNLTAHLAGAVGMRTLLVYPAANPPSHYWARTQDGRSRWYPSVEIVTDPEMDTWQRVFGAVRTRVDMMRGLIPAACSPPR